MGKKKSWETQSRRVSCYKRGLLCTASKRRKQCIFLLTKQRLDSVFFFCVSFPVPPDAPRTQQQGAAAPAARSSSSRRRRRSRRTRARQGPVLRPGGKGRRPQQQQQQQHRLQLRLGESFEIAEMTQLEEVYREGRDGEGEEFGINYSAPSPLRLRSAPTATVINSIPFPSPPPSFNRRRKQTSTAEFGRSKN